MASLSKALEARTAAVDLVPTEAVSNQDFLTFVTEIRGRDRLGKLRPLAHVAEAELKVLGIGEWEAYQKMLALVSDIRQSTGKLYAVIEGYRDGEGKVSKTFNISAQAMVFVGLRVGVGIGFQKRGRWSLRILTFSLGGIRPAGGVGVAVDLGLDTQKYKSGTSTFIRRETSEYLNDAFVVNKSSRNYTDQGAHNIDGEQRGLLFGIFGVSNDSNEIVEAGAVSIPIFFPIATNSYVKTAMKLQEKIIEAFHQFDFTSLARLTAEYKFQIDQAVKDAQNRGMSISRTSLEASHPFASIGSLFSPPVLATYSPELAPDYAAHYRRKAQGNLALDCESSVVKDSRALSAGDNVGVK
jgi:hypothetical protein